MEGEGGASVVVATAVVREGDRDAGMAAEEDRVVCRLPSGVLSVSEGAEGAEKGRGLRERGL